jgi:hypothetical protein
MQFDFSTLHVILAIDVSYVAEFLPSYGEGRYHEKMLNFVNDFSA